ncbi:MAG: CPBP family intramembrane metalloprotease [Candidatus Coatesbacteria bacterium]|nr:CPBP family intramembrane metalloprotease [Candidatus Coatesbacteria bacterium]
MNGADESRAPIPAGGPIGRKSRFALTQIAKLATFTGLYWMLGEALGTGNWADIDTLKISGNVVMLTVMLPVTYVLFRREARLLGKHLGEARKWLISIRFVILILLAEILLSTAITLSFYFWLPRHLSSAHPRTAKQIFEKVIMPIVERGEIDFNSSLALLIACIAAPAMEEMVFRGGLFALLLKFTGKLPAVFLSSLIFAGLHQIGIERINYMVLSVHVASGIALCLVLLFTRRLFWCFVLHSLWNTGIAILAILVLSYLVP